MRDIVDQFQGAREIAPSGRHTKAMDFGARAARQVCIGVEIQRNASPRDELGDGEGFQNLALVVSDIEGDRA